MEAEGILDRRVPRDVRLRPPGRPIGPEPASDSPDMRAAWHEAFRALEPADGPDVRGMPDGRLWLIRDTYTAETQWAPRQSARNYARSASARRTQNRNSYAPRRRLKLPASTTVTSAPRDMTSGPPRTRPWADLYRQQEESFAQAMHDRRDQRGHRGIRHLAIAADTEL